MRFAQRFDHVAVAVHQAEKAAVCSGTSSAAKGCTTYRSKSRALSRSSGTSDQVGSNRNMSSSRARGWRPSSIPGRRTAVRSSCWKRLIADRVEEIREVMSLMIEEFLEDVL